MEDTPEVRNGSKRRKSEVVMVSDLAVGESERPPMARSNSTFSAADLETALAKAGCGKFNLALLVLTFPASCTGSFDTSSMSFAMPAASVDLDLTLSQGALLQSSCYAGMIIGGFIWGPLSDAFGRKKLLVIGYLVDALMNFLAGAFPIFPLMMLFKFLAGLMICGLSPIFTAYIAEIYPKKGRDTVILSTGFSSATGQVLQASLAMWIIPIEVPSEIPFKSWQLFQMASALPSLISGIGCLFFVESPKFLADKGNHEGALKVCQTIYTINTGNRSSAYPVKRLNNTSKTTDYENKSKLSKLLEGLDILKPPFVQRAVVLFSINILAVGSFSTLRLWLPEMLTFVSKSTLDPNLGLCPLLEEGNSMRGNLSSTNLHSRDVFSTMMLVNSGCLIGHIVLLCTFSCIGIKAMQIICSLMAATCALIIPFISASYVFIVVSVFFTLYDMCITCIIKMVVEIFPTRIRATSISFLMLTSRMGILPLNFLMANFIYIYCEYLFYGLSLFGLVIAGLILIISKKPIEDDHQTSPIKGK